ncbi:MAG: ABC transporter ATP-binding protein/permease [Oscillospiraceae bacterium]|nr:ABC transporter ATP-binding protein/permease [Oscillospiraceae bacterium]
MKTLTAFRIFGRFFPGRKRYFIVASIATAVNIILMFLAPQVVRFTVDGIIDGDRNVLPSWLRFFYDLEPMTALIYAALVILGFVALGGVFSYISRLGVGRGTEQVIRSLRNTLFSHVQKLPFKWHTETLTGDIIQRCTSDVETLHNFLSMQLVDVVRTLVLIVTATVLMFTMNVPLALFAFAFVPIIVCYSMLFYGRIGKKFHKADVAEGVLMVRVQENLTGVRVVKAFGREQFELEKFHEKNNLFAKAWIDLGYLMGAYWGIGDIVTGMQTMGVVIFGTYLTVQGNMTLGALIAFISYSQILTWPVRNLGRTLSEMSQASVSATRLLDILNAEPEDVGGGVPDAPHSNASSEGAPCPVLAADIVFDHVTFAYRAAEVLHDLNFTIPKGTVFGVLGGTGSGKSTITYLLTRLYDLEPDHGKITIGGTDIRNIDRHYLRRQVGLVLQEPFLFSKTIGENIAITRDKADLRDIRRVARVADVDENILGFAKGYDTIVGERGVTLSGGQKQRVAIARTLLIDAPIMIFDDSLSAVDMETDAKIQAALRENTGGATVILISHRVSTLMHADQILVLDGGRQAELGDHKTLLAQDGIYSRVYKLQSEAGEGGKS